MSRVKSEIRVMAHLRRCQGEGAYGVIVRRGDPDAGAIAVKIYAGARQARLIVQSTSLDGEQIWRDSFSSLQDEHLIDERLAREIAMDPDLWIVEIEGCDGCGFLEIAPGD